MRTLKEIGATISSGTIITRLTAEKLKGEQAVDIQRKTIVSKTVERGYIDDEAIVYNDYKVLPDANKLTKEGDIIIKLAAPYRACIIDKEHEGMLISSFCSVIRNLSDEIYAKYLVAYLNSDECVKQLEQRAVGTTIAMLSNGKIADLPIPEPNAIKQIKIGNYFEKSVNNILLLKKISKLEQEKLNAMIAEIGGNE